MYEKCFKRVFDLLISFLSILILSPALVILTVTGTFAMGGNPFFVQKRPGRNEKIFKLVKFRTMNNMKDEDGNLLDSEKRLTGYGRFLRKTSLDELPELLNVFSGDMSLVGPRPLLIKYLPLYDETQKHRHDVKPGLTGLAQVNGRNLISWEEKFNYDVIYSKNVTLKNDIKIILKTFSLVAARRGIGTQNSEIMEEFKGNAEAKL